MSPNRDAVEEDERFFPWIFKAELGVRDVIELQAESMATPKLSRKGYGGAEFERKAEFFALSFDIDSGCKTRFENKVGCKVDVIASSKTKIGGAFLSQHQ